VDLLGRLIFAEGASQFRKPGVYLGLGNTVLNRMKARGFPNTLQGVILERAQNGVPQFASVGGRLWNAAANPAALTGDDATAYQAARAIAQDLLYGSEFNSYDPTLGATYFYSTTNNSPPAGFFTDRTNSGRLRETYRAGDPRSGEFRFLRDTQP
jgi:spore germination cell wall hydrolase CwlJ-like protein